MDAYDQIEYDTADWYAMGQEAYRSGQPLDLCPAPEDSLNAAVNWSSGWQDAHDAERAEERAWEEACTPPE